MKFFDYPTIYEAMRDHRVVEADRLSAESWYRQVGHQQANPMVQRQVCEECHWIADRRPYYSVWPLVAPALARVKLDVAGTQVRLPLPRMLIRFAEPLDGMHTIFVSHFDVDDNIGLGAWCDSGDRVTTNVATSDADAGKDVPLPNLTYCALRLGEATVEESISEAAKGFSEIANYEYRMKQATSMLKIIVAVCLMATDPDLVTADVLKKDQDKFEKTGADSYIEKAHNRGKIGWDVGARLTAMSESSPHFRRPYFGLRWTGVGRAIPKVVPIKGCVVKRSKIVKVPTGRLDEDQRCKACGCYLDDDAKDWCEACDVEDKRGYGKQDPPRTDDRFRHGRCHPEG